MGEIKLNDFNEFSYEVNYIDSFDNYDFSFFDYINIISIEKNIQFDIYFNKFLIDKNYVNDFINKHSDIQISLNNNAYNSIGNDLKYKPYEYQREIVDFILRKHSALIIACCGAGKTLIGICAYNELLKRKIINSKGLIIVKASLKEQWKNEVSKFSNLKAKIIETSSSINSKNNSKLKRLNAKLEKYKDTDKAKDIEKEVKALNKKIKNNFKEQFEDDGFADKDEFEEWIRKHIKVASFASVAFMWIRAEIIIALNQVGNIIHVPQSAQKQGASMANIIRLDAINPHTDDCYNDNTLSEITNEEFCVEDESIENNERINTFKDIVENVLYKLTDIERRIVKKRFGIDFPYELSINEIAENEYLSINKVKYILNNALKKISNEINDKDKEIIIQLLK